MVRQRGIGRRKKVARKSWKNKISSLANNSRHGTQSSSKFSNSTSSSSRSTNTSNSSISNNVVNNSVRSPSIESPSNVMLDNSVLATPSSGNDTSLTDTVIAPIISPGIGGDNSNHVNVHDNSDVSSSTDRITENNNHPSMSYSTRRRHVRKLKDCIFGIQGDINEKAKILMGFLNDTEILPILRAGGMLSPKESTINSHLIKQLMKQVERSSSKESSRGRTNDDMQSYRINAIGLITKTPESSSEVAFQPKDVRRILYSNTSIPGRTVRRLVKKAVNQRFFLTQQEKGTTWSVISHRKSYDTKQSTLYSSLLDWVLNHPHVISSPIYKDTLIVKVPTADGGYTKERVGKLLLEISVRELHDDMSKEPPIGFSGAYCNITKKLLISERHLRSILPPQLKPISESQKQMCGCECCTVMRMHHDSLLKYRKTVFEEYSNKRTMITRRQSSEFGSFDRYMCEVMVDNQPLFPKARDVIDSMTCKAVNNLSLPKWKCIMGRCDICPVPSLPQMELDENSPLRTICYCSYKYHVKCKLHGVLMNGSVTCDKCDNEVKSKVLEKPEKIVRRKEITLLESSISSFHKDVYIPMLQKFKYHIAIVSILSKNHCKKLRCEAFKENPSWMLSERDYAERLIKQLDGEIQSDHFGDNASLSIEGCTLQYHIKSESNDTSQNNGTIKMDFHSHFADYSRQDAATTFEHMCVMLDNHISIHGPLHKDCVYLDHTDGCAKQYRSGNALFLLNMLAIKYDIIIDRAVCAPGHGKSIIDGLNAVDKHYLKKVMCISGSTRCDDLNSRMKMFAMKQKYALSFAEECARLCGLSKRKFGVLPSGYDSNDSVKMSERFYYVQDPTQVRFVTLSKATKGWKRIHSQRRDGIQHHYNFRADPVLGPGYIAVRRIPCACKACVSQLKLPWILNKDFSEQPRYMSHNKDCVLWPIMEGLNDWLLISLTDTKPELNQIDRDMTQSIFKSSLESKAMTMISTIEVGNYCAISTTDDKAPSGYYIGIFRSTAYILQDNYYNGTERISAGELVSDITWLNPVPCCKTIFSHGLKDDNTLDSITRVQHIVHENVQYKLLESADKLPKNMRNHFCDLISKNTIVIDDLCHDTITECIYKRNNLDYEEYIQSSDEHYQSEDEFEDDD